MSNKDETLHDISKRHWTATQPNKIESVKVGSLQRIADALEIIAQNYKTLIEERNYYQREYKAAQEQIKSLKRHVAAYKGHIQRLKGKAKP